MHPTGSVTRTDWQERLSTVVEMSFPLLASEIQLQIAGYLKTDVLALGNLSSTSKHFRALLAPQFFQSIILRNTEESCDTVNLVVAKYGRYVKELRFIATASGNEEHDDYESGDVDAILPPAMEDILSNMHRFSSLETLCVELDINADYGSFFYLHWETLGHGQEGWDRMMESEASESWRALMAKSFASIARNTNPRFKALVIRNLLPVTVRTFDTAAFHKLLGHMQRFELYLHGSDNGAGWEMSGNYSFHGFIHSMDLWFFDHLTSVTDLTIHAHKKCRVGGQNYEIPLYDNQLLLLKVLRVMNVFLCPGLWRFLRSRAHTLEIIEFDGCFAYSGDDTEHQIFWAELFTAIVEAKPAKLRQLKITPVKVPLADDSVVTHPRYMKDGDWVEVAEARRKLEDSQRRPFSYGCIDDEFGYAEDDVIFNLERFKDGNDQRAFADLMCIVEANASSYRGRGI